MAMAYGATIDIVQRGRLGVISFFFLLVLMLITTKLVQHQIIEHAAFSTIAKEQHLANEEVPAKRGEVLVYDSELKDYYPLATNVSLYSLNIVPTQVRQPELTAAKLMPYLADTGVEESELISKMRSNKVYIPPLRRRIEEVEAKEIRALDLDGVILRAEEYRYYPEDSLASHILGFVNRDQDGQYGVEGYLDKELSGVGGLAAVEQSSSGVQITIGNRKIITPEDGASVVLTINRAVQYYVEKKLKEYVDRFEATNGEVVIMEPSTGKIVAMASYPNFNPNYYSEYPLEDFVNGNISSVYEPGSVFKIITMAAGMDTGLVSPSTVYTDTGEVLVDDKIIRNSDLKAHGLQTMTEVLEKSLNTGAVYVVQKLGRYLFSKYLTSFGFGSATGLELDGEVGAPVRSTKDWAEVDLAAISFGQGIAVTPMQLVSAFGAVANQGNLMKPHVIDKILYPSGAVSVDPQTIRSVIKPQVAQLLSAMMVSVVQNGHGKQAGVPGYKIAGKTGTAQIPTPSGGYEAWDTIGTFIGFGPVDSPRFVMLTKIDRPQGMRFAESSAAPLFGDIAKFLLNYWQVPPDK